MRGDNTNAKTFLATNYLVMFCGTVAATAALGLVISIFQVRSIHHLYVERLNKILYLHKNEFLNEIALEDMQSIRQHLDIVRNELDVDIVTLRSKDFSLSNADPKSRVQDLTIRLSNMLFARLIGVRPLVVQITNDFESVNANLTLVYDRSFAEWVLGPFLNFTFIIFLFAILLVGLIFFGLFKKTDRLLLSPLRDVTASFRNSEGDRLPSVAENAIGEIKALAEASETLRHAARSIALSELARQVAHDIRSPLSALAMIERDLGGLTEDKRILVRSALTRINDIANDLLQKAKMPNKKPGVKVEEFDFKLKMNATQSTSSIILLPAFIDNIVSEKRIQFRDKFNVVIESDLMKSFGLFVEANATELNRIVSNLVNNSVEAIDQNAGTVTVALRGANGYADILVIDNGPGVPPDVLAKLGQPGVTFGKMTKDSGSGLGVYHAKKHVENWKGYFAINSQLGRGTQVQIQLPLASTPEWFVNQVNLKENATVVVVDDDISIHQVWQSRLEMLGAGDKGVRIKNFTSAAEFRKFAIRDNMIFLMDYELLNQKATGLDLIIERGIASRSIMVTSRYDEDAVRKICDENKIKLLPKNLAALVPIKIENADQGSYPAYEISSVLGDGKQT